MASPFGITTTNFIHFTAPAKLLNYPGICSQVSTYLRHLVSSDAKAAAKATDPPNEHLRPSYEIQQFLKLFQPLFEQAATRPKAPKPAKLFSLLSCKQTRPLVHYPVPAIAQRL